MKTQTILKRFYVYKHSIDGTVFYVGEGARLRSTERASRNDVWKQIVSNNKDRYDIEIVDSFLNEADARQLERELIKEYKPLANKTRANKSSVRREVNAYDWNYWYGIDTEEWVWG